MKLEDAIYCPKCKEMFNQIEHGHGHRCPFCGNQCPSILDILLVLNTADILHKGKFGFGLKFFSELQKYNPKYKDSTNYTLYYTLDNAKDIFNNLDKILDKYYKINKEDCIRRKIINLKKELDELQKEEKE